MASILKQYPWLVHLPSEDKVEFLRLYSIELAKCDAKKDYESLKILLAQWEYTASVYADPDLLREWLKPIVEDEVTGKPALMPPKGESNSGKR